MITSIHFSLPWILKILNGSRLPLPLKTEKVSIKIITFAFCCTSSVSYRLYSAAYASDRHLDNCIKFSIDERLFACYTPIIAEANFCFRKEVFTMRMLKPEYFVKLEEYINDYQQKRGYSPSISDMVRDLGIPQTTVYRYLTHMKENGMLEINGRGKIITKGMAKTRRDTIKLDALGRRMKPDYISSTFSVLLEKKGLKRIRFHDLRHSCASLLLANGVPMKQIQEWLGHSDFNTTANIYAHLDYSSKVTSAQAMEKGLPLPEDFDTGGWDGVVST